MCLAIYKPAGAEIPLEYLKQGASSNRNGAGVAIRRQNGINIKKGLGEPQEIADIVSVNKDKDMLVHFRLATSGSSCAANCHPFPLSNKNEDLKAIEIKTNCAIVHNGVITQCRPVEQDLVDDLSDTMVFIKYILSDPGVDFHSPVIKRLIESFISTDRLAIMEQDKPVIMLGNWVEDNGVFYSNSGYKPYVYNYACQDYDNLYVGYYREQKHNKTKKKITIYNAAKEAKEILDHFSLLKIAFVSAWTSYGDLNVELKEQKDYDRFQKAYPERVMGHYFCAKSSFYFPSAR